MTFDLSVKSFVYETVATTTVPPTAGVVAAALKASVADVIEAFGRLQGQRLLVVEPGDPSRIRMAPPFAGLQTPFRAVAGGRSYWANCAWDALGILAALHEDGWVDASDGHTGEPIRIDVENAAPVPIDCAIHFAVPASRWWSDIVFT